MDQRIKWSGCTPCCVADNQRRQFTTDDFRNLFSYARHGKYKQVTELLKNGCPAEGRDQFGNSPLIIACQNGNARIVKAFLRHGALIDAQNKQGCTGLHYCIAYGRGPCSLFTPRLHSVSVH